MDNDSRAGSLSHDELRAKILAAARRAFGDGYTPSQLTKVEDVWDAAVETAAQACESYPGDPDDISGDAPATVQKDTADECAARIRALKGAPSTPRPKAPPPK